MYKKDIDDKNDWRLSDPGHVMAGREQNEDNKEELGIYDLNVMIKKLLKKAVIFGNIA
jgi:hypothetical protein